MTWVTHVDSNWCGVYTNTTVSMKWSKISIPLCASRKLYWTDQGTESGIPAKVSSADMDGSNPVNLFTNNLDHVEFLTVDISENKLYWAVTSTGAVGLYCVNPYL